VTTRAPSPVASTALITPLVALLVACGRVGFDPLTSGDGEPGDANSAPGDDASGGGGTQPDAGFVCPSSSFIEVTLGRTAPLDTCTFADRVIGCGASGSRELVLAFVPPATGSYLWAAYQPGTQNTATSTMQLDASCGTPAMLDCNGITGRMLTAGVPVYFVVEGTGGACIPIEFEIRLP